MKKTVYVIGVFDLFHRGHLEMLRRARQLGDRLVVAVNGDDFTESYKRRPLYSETDRAEIVGSLSVVDHVFIKKDADHSKELLSFEVSCVVHGDDWTGDSYLRQIGVSQDFVNEHGIEMVYIPYWQGISTSSLISTIKSVP